MTRLHTLTRSEHAEQVALIQTVTAHLGSHPDLRWLYAVPNGGKRDRVTGALLKAEGVKAGVPDLFLPVARGSHPGLVIELKVGRNTPTETQLEWLAHFQSQGWAVAVCYGADAAWNAIRAYLGIDV
ncbi:MAG TPA: VRR-NUC domain-containing protein [Roseiflexaceae bacterium]|nr:VRR-NUC domain-containing protein [Roseiflexaceae bacterium]